MLTKDQKFYKLLISIALPIAMQNLIIFSVSMADTLMLGQLGEVELSAVAISNHLFFIFMLLLFGLSGGANILISQYWGKGDTASIHKILGIMYKMCIVLAIIFMSIAFFVPKLFISIFTTDADVIAQGEKFLRIIGCSYIFYALTSCTIVVLRSVKTVKISLCVYSVSLCVNVFLNWLLIFGNWGVTPMGIYGAGVAYIKSNKIRKSSPIKMRFKK